MTDPGLPGSERMGPSRTGLGNTEPGTPVIEVRDVSVRFPGVLALDRVSLAIQPGTVHAIVGENGAGKSTLMKLLSGVQAIDQQEVAFDRLDVS